MHEAHRLYTEMGAVGHAERVASGAGGEPPRRVDGRRIESPQSYGPLAIRRL